MTTWLEVAQAVVVFLPTVLFGYFMSIVDIFTKRPKSMVGKIVVITGGASGIGREVAQMFANIGAKIALLDINTELNEKTANEINENAGLAVAFTVDVTKPDKMREVALRVQQHKQLGDPDMVICNAGILWPKGILEQSDDDIRRTMDINLMGYFWTIRAFLPRMLERNSGHIAAISSVSGYFGNTNSSSYSASKFAVRGLMESLEWELYDTRKHGVKVTTVYPFFTRTPLLAHCNVQSRIFQPLSVEQTAQTIVDAILFEKVEAYTSPLVSFWCNGLKATAPQRVKEAFKCLIDVQYK